MFGRRHKVIMDKLDLIHRDQAAAHEAMKSQLGEIHGQISATLDKLDSAIEGFNQRLTQNSRPKP